MRYLVALLFAALSFNAVGQSNQNYNPDYDDDGVIGVSDILGILSTFGDTWDSGDVIVGCTYPAAVEYNSSANVDDGSCTFLCCGVPVPHEGYYYSTVLIGDQCWFSENCRYLPSVSPSFEESDTASHYYVYGFEGSEVEAAKATANYATYGVLYNWPAVMTDSICPSGWHIPTDEEFTELTDFLGGDAGGKMKEAGNAHWTGVNIDNSSNSSGFTALPGGYRYPGGFYYMETHGWWWSSSESGSYSWSRGLFGGHTQVGREVANINKGFSARCVRD